MGLVRVEDVVLWISHIKGDEPLREKLLALPPDSLVPLEIAGRRGLWQKMKMASASGKPTSGLKPQDDIRAFWVDLYQRYKADGGIVVGIEDPEAPDARSVPPRDREVLDAPLTGPVDAADPARRDEALQRLRILRSEGWTSNGASYGRRDDWYAEE